MSQATDWSVPLIGPATPTTMAGRIDGSLDALLSSNSGAARPPYATAGTLWLSTAVAGQHQYYFFDGVNDRLFVTIDTATGVMTWPGGAMSGNLDLANNSLLRPAGSLIRGHISPGFNLANGADATNDIDFPAGFVASDETTPILMEHSAGTAQLDVAYGTGNGGRFDTSISDGTWHCFVISNGTTTSRGLSKSLNPTGTPNYPSGYTHYRRVASWLRESGSLVPMTQIEDVFKRKSASFTAISGTTPYAALLLYMGVPLGIIVQPMFSALLITNAAQSAQWLVGDAALGGLNTTIASAGATGAATAHQMSTYTPGGFFTDTSGRIYTSLTTSSGNVATAALSCNGWIDTRGRT